MKESKYNYSLSFDEKQLFFNGRTKKFFLVSQKNKDVYESILKFPDKYNGKYSSFIEKIKKDGFILEDDTDEYNIVALNFIKNYFSDNNISNIELLAASQYCITEIINC